MKIQIRDIIFSFTKIICSLLLTFFFFSMEEVVYAHTHNEACYGGTEHICDGTATNGGNCYTKQSEGNYIKTCGKTSGRYYNSNGQYLSPQCNIVGVSATAVEPIQHKETPLLKMNITFLDGHTETINAIRTDWSPAKDYSNGETITLYWKGLINNAKTQGELSAQIDFTSPIKHTSTPTPMETTTPTSTPIEEEPTPTQTIDNENDVDDKTILEDTEKEVENQDSTSLGIIEEEILETPEPTPTFVPTSTPIPTVKPTPSIQNNDVNKPIYYEDEEKQEEEILTIEDIKKREEHPLVFT